MWNYAELLIFSVSLLVLSILSIFLSLCKWLVTVEVRTPAYYLKLICSATTLSAALIFTLQFTALRTSDEVVCTVITQLGNFLLLIGAASSNFLALYRLHFMWDRSFKSPKIDEGDSHYFTMSNMIIGISVFRLFSQIAVFIEDPSISSTITLSTGVLESECKWGLGNTLIYLFSLDLAIILFVTCSMSIILWMSILDTVDEIEAEQKPKRRRRDSMEGSKIGKKPARRDSIYAVLFKPGNVVFPALIKAFLVKISVIFGINILTIVALSSPAFSFHAITIALLHGLFNLSLAVLDWKFFLSIFGFGNKRESDENNAEKGRQSSSKRSRNTVDSEYQMDEEDEEFE
jgi:hypothetical protein